MPRTRLPLPPHHLWTLRALAVLAVCMVLVGVWIGGWIGGWLGVAVAASTIGGSLVGAFTVLPLSNVIYVRTLARATERGSTRRPRRRH
ncbi:hypothetical protein [Streptomyces sp. NPDC005538]|uniref:hypothetical protein n=1 Tax=Streptomyces sp. NPDC005538 TaxID=3157043 RepID=UPI0033B6C5A4